MKTSTKILNQCAVYYQFIKQLLITHVFNKENKTYLKHFLQDIRTCFINVFKNIAKINLSKKSWRVFIIEEIIATGTGWYAGIFAADLISTNYKFKSVNNLWGLTGRRDGKEMISKEDYELYNTYSSYIIGLLMMVIVRYLIMQILHEFEKVREERKSNYTTD
ncbi:hypothetical protein MY04_4760 [Flammeovirga sp. MY04]|uniref:hypothetical protein n=1 Tax=Flammeovirga sp. MY04 TaxID=1191459 RepID=UPI000824498A|nr:hypothetical protein [Flammeovirga sp. MY04]ANQ52095.2 hypothetical protein MY04_4760 [Flammeovirga sp. MY04]